MFLKAHDITRQQPTLGQVQTFLGHDIPDGRRVGPSWISSSHLGRSVRQAFFHFYPKLSAICCPIPLEIIICLFCRFPRFAHQLQIGLPCVGLDAPGFFLREMKVDFAWAFSHQFCWWGQHVLKDSAPNPSLVPAN